MVCPKCGVEFDGPALVCCRQCTRQVAERMNRAKLKIYLDSVVVRNEDYLNLDDENFIVVNGILIYYKGDSQHVTIPDGVTGIGDRVFKTKRVTNLSIPRTVTHIGLLAFQETPWYHNLREKYTMVGDQILLKYNGKNKTPSIPPGVKSIAYHAFALQELTAVTIPDSVTHIGDSAFSHNCLSVVTIPNSVTSIALGAFAQNQLRTVHISDSVTEIGEVAFLNNQITTLTIPASVLRIGDGAFSGNPLQSIAIDKIEGSIPLEQRDEDDAFYPWGATTNGVHDGTATPIHWQSLS